MTATLAPVLATSTVPVCGDASGTLPSPSPAGTPRNHRNSSAGHLIVTPADDSGEVESYEVSLPAISQDDRPPDQGRDYFPAPRARPSTRLAADAPTMAQAVGLAAGVGA